MTTKKELISNITCDEIHALYQGYEVPKCHNSAVSESPLKTLTEVDDKGKLFVLKMKTV
ncbi:MAG: hypothetical protein LBS92_01190 [Candidatus Methanoplasma sp.]|nr:hypothetical protein [Candidatus Methanoplasma sp.]